MNRGTEWGLALIFLSLVLTLLNPNITGNATLEDVPTHSINIFVFVMFVMGSFLTAQTLDKQNRINDIVIGYNKGDYGPVKAAEELNNIIEVRGVDYTTGKKHSLRGLWNKYTLPLKKGKKAEELALAEYILAQKNNPSGIRDNSIEIKKGVSTKHYMKGIKNRLDAFIDKYAGQLEQSVAFA